jgi:CCR4-NOT transcription complex subunit 3
MQNNKKQEDLSPEELWKKVSQQLSSKKYETATKHAYNTMFDLTLIQNEILKERDIKLKNNSNLKLNLIELENSVINTPFFNELEPKSLNYKRIKTPAFFPKTPYLSFSNSNFYKKLDLDTLFFVFYYFKGLPQQAYAATRLKEISWRFHLKYQVWFQRLEEPKLITSEYEKGDFLFFNFENTWSFMKKTNFVFEYFYLESSENY